jgi:Mn2+/Fe2+ NRAMP family transporter
LIERHHRPATAHDETPPNQLALNDAINAAARMVGMVMGFSPLDPIKALFWSAVINGLVAVPVMVMIMLLTSNKEIMVKFAVAGPVCTETQTRTYW